jgi:aryl-alcohol dehydrogenase-like predicted oxidoreductase
MSWEDSLGNARALDKWRQTAGQRYEGEKPENLRPVPARQIARLPQVPMKYGEIEGVGKPVSRVMLGADWAPGSPADAFAVYDYFFERGGNAIDTSWWYGHGASDRTLATWMKTRGVREQCVVFAKGAHTPYNTPEYGDEEIRKSSEILGRLDIYCYHRDNEKVPVGEFVDVCSRHVREGRIGAWGGSNWTIERTTAAIEYATRNNLVPPRVLSNNFSLAIMNEPIWAGCLHNSDAGSIGWLTKHQIALLPWSSQARGFFVDGMAHPEKKDNGELVRVFYSDENFARLDRCRKLAAKMNVLPINVALAYVLCQPFPTFPLIGPRQLSETRSSFAALDVDLSAKELKWLNLEA